MPKNPVSRQLSNSELRTLFLGSALKRSVPVTGNQAAALGGTVSFSLPHAGIARGCLITVYMPVTIASGTPTATQKAPYNMITNVSLSYGAAIQ